MARNAPSNGSDHDGRGRFTAGNKAGKGNPHHRRVAELRAKMLERVTPDDVSAVVEALVNKAKAGDTAAIKLLLDRVFGRIADHDAAAAEDRAERDALRRERERERVEREAGLNEAEAVIHEAEQRRMLELRASMAGVELPE
ncbi:MAG: hypothetical protein JNG88_13920 [Phycisphaerales bacterium]|nr:hypothetical protein [Phycisphaerales bacterium]